jgi:hypothetical protein
VDDEDGLDSMSEGGSEGKERGVVRGVVVGALLTSSENSGLDSRGRDILDHLRFNSVFRRLRI